jgi:hypothetical protein
MYDLAPAHLHKLESSLVEAFSSAILPSAILAILPSAISIKYAWCICDITALVFPLLGAAGADDVCAWEGLARSGWSLRRAPLRGLWSSSDIGARDGRLVRRCAAAGQSGNGHCCKITSLLPA